MCATSVNMGAACHRLYLTGGPLFSLCLCSLVFDTSGVDLLFSVLPFVSPDTVSERALVRCAATEVQSNLSAGVSRPKVIGRVADLDVGTGTALAMSASWEPKGMDWHHAVRLV